MASLSLIYSLPFFTTLLFMLGISNVSAQLSPNFYTRKCPLALTTIKTVVTTTVLSDRRMGASLLRLHFHDCFVLASPLFPYLIITFPPKLTLNINAATFIIFINNLLYMCVGMLDLSLGVIIFLY